MKEEVMYQGENIKERGKIFIKLLLPVLIYQVISYSSGMIGTFMAGHYSPTDLAGVSMGVNIWNPVMYTLNAIVLAIVPIVSHLIGKKREDIAFFLKHTFAHTLRDVEVSSIQRKLTNTEGKYLIPLCKDLVIDEHSTLLESYPKVT